MPFGRDTGTFFVKAARKWNPIFSHGENDSGNIYGRNRLSMAKAETGTHGAGSPSGLFLFCFLPAESFVRIIGNPDKTRAALSNKGMGDRAFLQTTAQFPKNTPCASEEYGVLHLGPAYSEPPTQNGEESE